MEEHKTTVEKRTEVTREKVTEPKSTNVNIGSDGSTQITEESEVVVEEPVSSTIIRQEETVEKQQR